MRRRRKKKIIMKTRKRLSLRMIYQQSRQFIHLSEILANKRLAFATRSPFRIVPVEIGKFIPILWKGSYF